MLPGRRRLGHRCLTIEVIFGSEEQGQRQFSFQLFAQMEGVELGLFGSQRGLGWLGRAERFHRALQWSLRFFDEMALGKSSFARATTRGDGRHSPTLPGSGCSSRSFAIGPTAGERYAALDQMAMQRPVEGLGPVVGVKLFTAKGSTFSISPN